MAFFQVFVLFALFCLLYQMREHLRRLGKLQQEIAELKHLITGHPPSGTQTGQEGP